MWTTTGSKKRCDIGGFYEIDRSDDNTTRIDAYYLGEPGVSYYIQDSGKSILFDAGNSYVFIRIPGIHEAKG